MIMELLIIILDPHMILYFMTNETWYAFVFGVLSSVCELRTDPYKNMPPPQPPNNPPYHKTRVATYDWHILKACQV